MLFKVLCYGYVSFKVLQSYDQKFDLANLFICCATQQPIAQQEICQKYVVQHGFYDLKQQNSCNKYDKY